MPPLCPLPGDSGLAFQSCPGSLPTGLGASGGPPLPHQRRGYSAPENGGAFRSPQTVPHIPVGALGGPPLPRAFLPPPPALQSSAGQRSGRGAPPAAGRCPGGRTRLWCSLTVFFRLPLRLLPPLRVVSVRGSFPYQPAHAAALSEDRVTSPKGGGTEGQGSTSRRGPESCLRFLVCPE